MSWNYRIIRKIDDLNNPYCEIYEVYYNDKGEIVAHTLNPQLAFGDTPEELIEDLKLMLRDAEKHKDDILEYGKIKFNGNL